MGLRIASAKSSNEDEITIQLVCSLNGEDTRCYTIECDSTGIGGLLINILDPITEEPFVSIIPEERFDNERRDTSISFDCRQSARYPVLHLDVLADTAEGNEGGVSIAQEFSPESINNCGI